ncbi:MAG: glycine zipper 2TM domain-containing protein [Shewanella sp.]|nr:glycine zipper 2TM domain-containing protein [Shewanella sp.]MCF1429677.1 glycine zipper 2TM domain-containing protein [Shewanella sp.]MCF1437429.1 glycine zipper 2TM domain-containing protein [Shewanella sp.]MCF1456311.1 glycine zipper 2TM domain-containing protein [Shewanella sp.]
MNTKPLLVINLLSTLGLSACATGPNPYGDTYSVADAQQIQTLETGTIVKLIPVSLEGENASTVGTIAGGAIGALLGSHVGGGTGSDIAAIGGGLLGGIVGNEAGKAAGKRQGVNIVIRLDNGQTIAVVQQVNQHILFQVGERVEIYQLNGSARVVPADEYEGNTTQ